MKVEITKCDFDNSYDNTNHFECSNMNKNKIAEFVEHSNLLNAIINTI